MKRILQVVTVCLALLCLSVTAFAADYYVIVNDSQQGPVPMDQLQQMAKDGTVSKGSMVWKDGMAGWVKAGDQQDLQGLFVTSPPPLPPAMPSSTPPPTQEQILPQEEIPLTDFEDKEDISNMISDRVNKYRLNPEIMRKNYTFGTGQIPFDGNFKTDVGIDDFYLTFKTAVAQATAKMIVEETYANLSSSLSANLSGSKGDNASNRKQCVDEYKEKVKAVKEKEQEFTSRVGKQIEKLANKFAPLENLDREKIEEEKKEALDSIIQCEAIEDPSRMLAQLTSAANGSMEGLRIFETILQDKQIAVITGRNAETARSAGILRQSRLIAEPLSTAIEESLVIADNMVQDYMRQYKKPPFGLAGIRMKRLSNGEFALVSFGVSSKNKGNTFANNMDNSLSIESAEARALAALNEFAYITSSKKYNENINKKFQNTIVETIDMAKQGEQVSFADKIDNLLRTEMSLNLNVAAKGVVSSPLLAGTKAYKGGDDFPSFYLSTYIWSPSIMSINKGKGRANKAAYDQGRKTNSEGGSSTEKGGSTKGTTTFKVKEDW